MFWVQAMSHSIYLEHFVYKWHRDFDTAFVNRLTKEKRISKNKQKQTFQKVHVMKWKFLLFIGQRFTICLVWHYYIYISEVPSFFQIKLENTKRLQSQLNFIEELYMGLKSALEI